MPRPRRALSVACALLLTAFLSSAGSPARGQVPSTGRAAPSAALVVLVPAGDSAVSPSNVARAVAGREVTAVYTTDTPATRRLAERLHDRLGGSLIPYDRGGAAAVDFAGVLVENAVDYAGRRNLGRAVLVVAEPDLARPFLRLAAGARAADAAAAGRATDGFVITLAPDDSRTVARTPF